MIRRPPRSPPFPYTTLSRSPPPRRRDPGAPRRRRDGAGSRGEQAKRETAPLARHRIDADQAHAVRAEEQLAPVRRASRGGEAKASETRVREDRSEEHTAELQSLAYLVWRLLL